MAIGSDNPFPSILLEEHVDPATPPSGHWRLFMDTDNTFKKIDDAGTVTSLEAAGGFSDPMTTRGDVIVRNASNVTARLAIGSSGKVLSSDGTDISWQTPAGGGLTQSYVGYNTAGGSYETLTTKRAYWKSVTLASTSHVQNLGLRLRPSTDNVSGIMVMIATDNSTAPGVLIAANAMPTSGMYLSNSSSMPGTARWLDIPLSATLAAGTYWFGFMSDGTLYDIAYDGSGSDQYFTSSLFIATGAYPTAWAITTGTRKYSIRASILS